MFTAVSKMAPKIVNIGSKSLCTEILTLEMMATVATHKELIGMHVLYTSDRWTGPNDETYTTVTAHYIAEDWVMRSVRIDFNVFQGRTTGENTYADIMAVLARFMSEGHQHELNLCRIQLELPTQLVTWANLASFFVTVVMNTLLN